MKDQRYSLSNLMGTPAKCEYDRGIEEPDWRPPPVRIIPVTDEMRARDAAQRRARETAPSDWKIKEELRAENLVGMKRVRGGA